MFQNVHRPDPAACRRQQPERLPTKRPPRRRTDLATLRARGAVRSRPVPGAHFGTAARPLSWRRFRPLQNLLVTSVPVLYQVAGATGAEREVQWVGDDHSRKLCKFFNRPSGCRCAQRALAPRKTVDRMRPKTAPVGAQKRRGLHVHPSTRAGWQGGGDGGAGGSCQRSCAALCEDCGDAGCAGCDRADIGCE